jgi:hypothetical protein
MTDPLNRPVVPPGDLDPEKQDELPEHELDRDETVGGGVMETGGTAVDRGTGTLTGKAQGTAEDEDQDDPLEPDRIDDDAVVPPKQV